MFNLHLCNATTIWVFPIELWTHGSLWHRLWNSFGCIAAIRCGSACHRLHSDCIYSGNEHNQFNSSRLVKHEAGFPNPRQALIGSNQLWRINDSSYYQEYDKFSLAECNVICFLQYIIFLNASVNLLHLSGHYGWACIKKCMRKFG